MPQNKAHLDVNIFKPNTLTVMYEIKRKVLLAATKLLIRLSKVINL